ncbi:MAG: PAS domain-containing sensor histidine kinase [Pseudorhodoplanes sp.]|nr:Adaptive-response sensory-kinase SasA [Pseudorhodoplanes sp.]MBW7949487.1 PAS domain-containing sensor histidine kinase [Pseudorhodoplanes sp.]MCL4710787.1 PAS domain-containing sensor histidine kinase [Pseudorhodoplanes sp.]MCQ3943633.1 PAS domain-containing sensor histidine kinase [Alphaproteobacteria bacterium]
MANADQTASADVLAGFAGNRRLKRWLGPVAVLIALLSALLTFVVLTGLTPILPTHQVVVGLLLADAVAALFLISVIGSEMWTIVQARRRGRAASELHIRIIALFSVIAAAPAIMVAIVASVTLDRGLDRLFSTRTRAVIENSLHVSEAYLREHGQLIRNDIGAMSIDVGRAKPLFDQDRDRFRQFLTAQISIRGLRAVALIDSNLTIIERSNLSGTADFVVPSKSFIERITETEPQIALIPEANYVAAIIKLRNFDDTYLYITRSLDPRVVAQLRETRANVVEYASLEARRLGVQIAFGLMYTVIALILLLSAVWIGLNFANRLVAPIRRLIGAANVVSTGNLHVQVPIRRAEGDLAQLGETFNKMTQELRTQRDDLVRARDQIDSRRRFTEAVLAGASAGVIGVDHDGRISILNRSAEKLIGYGETEALGHMLLEVVPELADLVAAAQEGNQRLVQGQVTISRAGRERNLSVCVASEQSADAEHGYVVTLDDITELVAAQRTSAWADVARRIAHEIKNPLTPIQLSAERLRRKYGKTITDDPAVFQQCTDTIVRQVDDIRRMVDEFSRFARMPKPVIAQEDVADTVRQATFLMRVGHPDVDIEHTIAEDPMPARFDRRLISQALTNIIKNAAEAIAAAPMKGERGRIDVAAQRAGSDVTIDIVDNGVGLPKEGRGRLLEPYVTTREKGTGLGLAIVGKILEEHGGGIELHDAAEREAGRRGAWIRMRFQADPPPTIATNEEKSLVTGQ